MAVNEDSQLLTRPKAPKSARKCEKSIVGKISRLYLLVLCFTLIVNKGFLFVDALEVHRHRGE